MPETKEAIAVLRQLHADGVLSPEWPVLGTWAEAPDEIAQNKVGASFAQQWWHNWGAPTQVVANNPGVEWTHVVPRTLSGEYARIPVTAQITDINAVRAGYEHPEVLIKLYNLHYQKVKNPETADGNFHTIQTDAGPVSAFFYWNDFFAAYAVDTNPLLALDVTEAINTGDTSKLNPEAMGYYNGAMAYLNGTAKLTGNDGGYGNYKTFGPGGTQALNWEVVLGRDDGNIVDAYQGVPTKAQADYAGDLRSTRNELFIQMVVGELDIDDGWDQWLAYWESNGGAEWTDQVNEWKASR
jgi:putative aldouronate transport system substrate-binding protein